MPLDAFLGTARAVAAEPKAKPKQSKRKQTRTETSASKTSANIPPPLKPSNYYDDLLEASFLDPADDIMIGNDKWDWIYEEENEEEKKEDDDDVESESYTDEETSGTSLNAAREEDDEVAWNPGSAMSDDEPCRWDRAIEHKKQPKPRAMGAVKLLPEDDSWIA